VTEQTEILFSSQKISKSHAIVELYGQIDEVSSALDFVTYYAYAAEMLSVATYSEALSRYLSQEILALLSQLYIARCKDDLIFDAKKCENFTNKFNDDILLSNIKAPETHIFVHRWKNEVVLWLNEVRVRIRRLERHLTNMLDEIQNDIYYSSDIQAMRERVIAWLCVIDFVNKLSTFLFNLGVNLNG